MRICSPCFTRCRTGDVAASAVRYNRQALSLPLNDDRG